MADNERKFSHISVSSDEDDEFVIEAGVPAAGKQLDVPEAEAFDAAGQEAQARIVRPKEAAAPQDALDASREKACAAERSQVGKQGAPAPGSSRAGVHSTPGKASSSAASAAPARRKDDSYQPTTLEDLKGTPMSTMQKVIIALALAGVVAAVVYYVVFFG